MYGDCMLVGCRLRKERTEFKASLDSIETQCPLERKQPSFGGSDGDSMCSALACTVRTAVSAAVHTFVLCQNGEVILALSSFFLYVWFSDISDRTQKKTSKLELTKGKNDFLKIIIRQYFALDMGTFTIPKVNITK